MFIVFIDPKHIGVDMTFMLLCLLVFHVKVFDLENLTNAEMRKPEKKFHDFT